MELTVGAACVVAGYLFGSLSFAVIVSRVMGLADPRSYGSGNPGATNVLRSGSRKAAVLTLALDALKGYVPVLLVLLFGQQLGLREHTELVAGLTGLAAFVGHLWPLFFRFQGGKGVATAAGVLLALQPLLGLATLASWALMAAFFRYSSLASITAAVFAPFYQLLIWGLEPVFWPILLMSALLIVRHRANIDKLIAGTESRIGQKAAPAAAAAGHGHGQHPGHKHAKKGQPK